MEEDHDEGNLRACSDAIVEDQVVENRRPQNLWIFPADLRCSKSLCGLFLQVGMRRTGMAHLVAVPAGLKDVN